MVEAPTTAPTITCQVACGLATRQLVMTVEVARGSSYAEAITCSAIMQYFPQLAWPAEAIAVYGEKRDLHDVVQDGERIDILRPLQRDPMSRRRALAVKY